MSETKTNFKNELKPAASLTLTFSLPILQHNLIHQNDPLVSYSSCSSTLVRGFRVGPTPVIRKIVREEKEGI